MQMPMRSRKARGVRPPSAARGEHSTRTQLPTEGSWWTLRTSFTDA